MLTVSWPLLSLRTYVIAFPCCRTSCWPCRCLCHPSDCTWLHSLPVKACADCTTVFATSQLVRDCIPLLWNLVLTVSLPLPSLSLYVILFPYCEISCWSCCNHCRPLGSTWLHSTAVQPPLTVSLPLPSLRSYVISFPRCAISCWLCRRFCYPSASTWLHSPVVKSRADCVAAFAIPQIVRDFIPLLWNLVLTVSWPLLSLRAYVIAFPTVKSRADRVAAFAIPQTVRDCIPLLWNPVLTVPRSLLPLSSYVIAFPCCGT